MRFATQPVVPDAERASVDGVFSGRVGKVCQKQGCWLQLIDGEQMARVMTHHDFTVPKDLAGGAVVSGKLERVELSEKEARHMAEDAGKAFDPAASRVESASTDSRMPRPSMTDSAMREANRRIERSASSLPGMT